MISGSCCSYTSVAVGVLVELTTLLLMSDDIVCIRLHGIRGRGFEQGSSHLPWMMFEGGDSVYACLARWQLSSDLQWLYYLV